MQWPAAESRTKPNFRLFIYLFYIIHVLLFRPLCLIQASKSALNKTEKKIRNVPVLQQKDVVGCWAALQLLISNAGK